MEEKCAFNVFRLSIGYGIRIEKKKVVKETTKFFVFPNGRREAKVSNWHEYFKTFNDAKKRLLDILLRKEKAAKFAAKTARKNYELFIKLKESDLK